MTIEHCLPHKVCLLLSTGECESVNITPPDWQSTASISSQTLSIQSAQLGRLATAERTTRRRRARPITNERARLPTPGRTIDSRKTQPKYRTSNGSSNEPVVPDRQTDRRTDRSPSSSSPSSGPSVCLAARAQADRAMFDMSRHDNERRRLDPLSNSIEALARARAATGCRANPHRRVTTTSTPTTLTAMDSDVGVFAPRKSHLQEVRVWTHALRHGRTARSPTPTDAPSPLLSPTCTNRKMAESRRKTLRFALRQLFKHERPDRVAHKTAVAATTAGGIVPPVSIPTTYLTREKQGCVTVSGKRVPFTRDAHTHKKTKKVGKPLPSIKEDCALVPVHSSLEAYRRRAYYPAKKVKTKKVRPAANSV